MISESGYNSIESSEREARLLDRWGQECYRATLSTFGAINRDHPLDRPRRDEERLQAGHGTPVWPAGAKFAVCLTHDVDNLASFVSRLHWRRIVNQCRCLGNDWEARAVKSLRSSVYSWFQAMNPTRPTERLDGYDQWLVMEEEVGAKSTFLFLPDRYGRRHYTDGGYRYRDKVRFGGQRCTVAEMMREIHDRGWEVGLHASWQSYDSIDEMKRQKTQVERAIRAEVLSVRHHNLHFDIRRTARVHHQAGLAFDSSLGFNDNIGFRCETSYPWRLRDLNANELLNVLELPLVIQDKCLIEAIAGGSEDLAMECVERMADRVSQVGGVLTLLWHPRMLTNSTYVSVYQHALNHLKASGAWFGTMAEIGRWWLDVNCANTTPAPHHVSEGASCESPPRGTNPLHFHGGYLPAERPGRE